MSVGPPALQVSVNTLSSSWPEAPPRRGGSLPRRQVSRCRRWAHIILTAVLCGGSSPTDLGALSEDAEIGLGLGALPAGLDGGDVGRQQGLSRLPNVAAQSSCSDRAGLVLVCCRQGRSPHAWRTDLWEALRLSKPSPPAFFPAGQKVRLLAAASLPKKPSAQVLRMRCAPKMGSKAFRLPSRSRHREGIGPSREQQKRTRP